MMKKPFLQNIRKQAIRAKEIYKKTLVFFWEKRVVTYSKNLDQTCFVVFNGFEDSIMLDFVFLTEVLYSSGGFSIHSRG